MKTIHLCEKREAVLAQSGHLLVTGGPGAGKTTIALLKAQRRCTSLEPGQEILFLSFSRAAVRQISAGCDNVLTRGERALIQVLTYHSFGLEFLKSFGRMLAGKRPRFVYPGQESLRRAAFEGDWKTEQQRLALEDGTFCFDVLAGTVATILEGSTVLGSLISDKYPMVIVDEFQDTDNDQWRLVRVLAKSADLFCLADPDQRIFEYRGNVDPKRLDMLREAVKPIEFNFDGENRRSNSDGGILDFANAVLFNRSPLPGAKDVKMMSYYPKSFDSTVHAAVAWTFGRLREKGISRPCVAVLTRTNDLVMAISETLGEKHVYSKKEYRPIEHEVLWDADVAFAAAGVLGSILEWSSDGSEMQLAATMDALAMFYRIRNGAKPSKSAVESARKWSESAALVAQKKKPKIKAAQELATLFASRLTFTGDPTRDWLTARRSLESNSGLQDVAREVRLVRLFRARDALAKGLADRWLAEGHYRGAADLVRRILERERLVGSERDPDGCVLMNMHKSKGKEFDGVVLVEGTYSGTFFSPSEQPPFEQSRRLLRVAITRARSFVAIVRPQNAAPLVG